MGLGPKATQAKSPKSIHTHAHGDMSPAILAGLVRLAGFILLRNGGCGLRATTVSCGATRSRPSDPACGEAPTERSPAEKGEIRRCVQSAVHGGGGGPQARVQHHRAHLQRAPQRRPHRLPHLQPPPVSTAQLPLSRPALICLSPLRLLLLRLRRDLQW